MTFSTDAMSDWITARPITKALPPEGLRTPQDTPKPPPIAVKGGYCEIHGEFDSPCSECCDYYIRSDGPVIRLDALAGPQETMHAAGFTNRGSLAYAMQHRGFPQPVKVLRGIRLWDLDTVNQWKRSTP